ncbi:adenylate/guanylate cyclase domain-containing protein [Jidongwangia harbinensis]|uniref:adenylate/guanylate cyclase domain-containing protein n=1 Tax=Jidongwangia harbinensis TaxID=2878561 RepID=UPI001CD9B1E5|nr:adenylate/guanylate cyclase domain-containing protein [Jidongwangia harbinensis]MCA2218972.1 adenylate/guanylate cyclase domain-containing protein [Jidongwangia harbinensis]
MDVVRELDMHLDSGRRRRAAVLFADLTGFTRLVETVEPEIVYQVVRPLLDDLAAIASRHGGEIQQVLGDGFMCVFGAHETLGDEAHRAVRAGRAMIAAGGTAVVRPPVHAGVEYGDVYVTPSWPPAGYGVWGRTVNLAKRLCDLAGPGELQIGPEAFARTADLVGPTLAGRTRLKGIVDPVVTHRLPAAA